MLEMWLRRAWVIALLMVGLAAAGATGCDRESKEAEEGRDWRPVVDKIDRALVERVLKAEGWTLDEGEPMEMTLTAEDVRSAGGRAEGDTHMMSISARRGEQHVSVVLTTYPGDVKPARGDRGIVMGGPMLAAGTRGVMISVTDAELEEDTEAGDALLDALIAAAGQ